MKKLPTHLLLWDHLVQWWAAQTFRMQVSRMWSVLFPWFVAGQGQVIVKPINYCVRGWGRQRGMKGAEGKAEQSKRDKLILPHQGTYNHSLSVCSRTAHWRVWLYPTLWEAYAAWMLYRQAKDKKMLFYLLDLSSYWNALLYFSWEFTALHSFVNNKQHSTNCIY